MKILHVVDQMDPKRGGVCQAIRTIIKGASLLGESNEVVSLDDPKSDFLSGDSFKTHALGPADNPWSYSKDIKAWLISNLLNYDKVIIHGLWQFPSYAVYLAKRDLMKNDNSEGSKPYKLPQIYVMPHGMLDPYFQRAASRKLKAVRNTLYWKIIENKIINTADALLFTCDEEKNLARQPFSPYRPPKELVIGLGVERPPDETVEMQKAFQSKCAGLNESKYILFISRIHEKKGVDLLIQAYSNWLDEHSTDSDGNKNTTILKLVIAGPGIETDYGKKIESEVEGNNNLKNNVLFPGMLVADAKWGAFYGCEAFILPSHQENFGIAVVEALACGKPVLISDQVNIWREIEDGKAGIIGSDTLKGTLKIIEKWNDLSKENQENMAINAKLTFNNHFTINSAAARLVEALNENSL
ncbi:MAG TPA: glycosyltransferase [Leeuwenhoekiella sp.]|nr:glycosyltransferase [Leeuwenhoekiella sp.]